MVFWEVAILKSRKIELVKLKNVAPKQEVEIKEPLTREQAVARLVELDSALRKVYCRNPNFTHWGWKLPEVLPEQVFSLQGGAVSDKKTKRLPIRFDRKFHSQNSEKFYKQTHKLLSRYALAGGLLITGGLMALFGFSPAILAPLTIGAVCSGFSITRFYDGTRKNKIRWILSSIFLGKKSRKAIESYQKKLERFNFLKESYDIFAKLILQEIESDNLLGIANSEPDDGGNYIAFLEHGELVRVPKKKYEELLKESSPEKTKEEVLQLAHKMIEDKFSSLSLKELDA